MVRWRLIEIATIAALALSLWCLAGDVPGGVPIAEEEAVAGAFRHMVTSIDRESQKPLAACVAMRLAAGDEVPSQFLDDVMASHPGFKMGVRVPTPGTEVLSWRRRPARTPPLVRGIAMAPDISQLGQGRVLGALGAVEWNDGGLRREPIVHWRA
jgi:hypothetical protein